MHGKNDERDLGELRLQLFHQLEPGFVFQGNVDQSDVWLGRFDSSNRARRVFGFATHEQITLLIDEICESVANERMIVHDKYSALPRHAIG